MYPSDTESAHPGAVAPRGSRVGPPPSASPGSADLRLGSGAGSLSLAGPFSFKRVRPADRSLQAVRTQTPTRYDGHIC